MNLADPVRPFFSYQSHKGETLVCLLGQAQNGLVSFDAYRRDLDMPVSGVWNPRQHTLALHGDDGFVETNAVIHQGRHIIVEKDGSLTVNTDDDRHLIEGEFLIGANFLDNVAPGRRHDEINLTVDDDEEDTSFELFAAHSANQLGHSLCSL